MMQTLTMKFGGTSVHNSEAIVQVMEIVQEAGSTQVERLAVVVSAISGVTDLLQEGTLSAAGGDPQRHYEIADELRRLHHQAAEGLLDDELDGLLAEIDGLIDGYAGFCDSVYVLGEATPRALDHTMSLGERLSARLVAAALRQAGMSAQLVEATRLIVTDERFQDAAPLLEATRDRVRQELQPLLEQGKLPVITGFIGATPDGITTTLGRGGSDYSAALIGSFLDSDELWVWTDVDGVMSADPRIVPEARSIEVLSYREVSELAYFGAKVLHPKTIRPVLESGIPLHVKNTFNPRHPGTRIVRSHEASDGAIKAVTAIPQVSLITVEGMGMLGVPGIAARTFGAVASTGTSVLLISQASSEQSICFAVPQASAQTAAQAVRAEFELELNRHDIDRVWAQDGITIVTVVGAGMRGTPGVAGRVFNATGQWGINVVAIAQGSSECSLSLVIGAEDAPDAVRQIHREVIING